MNQSRTPSLPERCISLVRPWLFPFAVVCLYGLCSLLAPEKARRAILFSSSMFRQLALPLCLAIVLMIALNKYLSPTLATRFLGTGTGLKGLLLSSLAGMLSMGPIYAWYPLFKTLKENGASNLIIANFIGSRSIKPALFPVLLAYFGWHFTVIFVFLNLVGALGTAHIVHWTCPDSTSHLADNQAARKDSAP